MSGDPVLPEPTVLSTEPTLLLSRARPLGARSSTLLNSHPLTLIRSLTLIRAPRMRPGRPKTGVRLRRTWRVAGNMGFTYEV